MLKNQGINRTPADSKTAIAYLGVPVGTIASFIGKVPPDGWLFCHGQDIAPADYPALCNLLEGTKVPDLRSRFIVGAGQGTGLSNYPLKDANGVESVTLSLEQIPSHKHFGFGEAWADWPMGIDSSNQKGSKGGIDNDNHFYGTTDAGGGKPHENRPPYYALSYIIKY